MRFNTNASERMRINANGQLLVGTTDAPSNTDTKLRVHVPISSSSKTAFELSHNTTGANKPGASLGLVVDNGGSSTNAGQLTFGTASGGSVSERMRIDSSGNVFVKKTSSDGGQVGVELLSSGAVFATRDNNFPLFLNRTSSDGDIALFRKDGTTVGSLGVENGSLSVRRPSGTNGLIQTFGQPTHGIVGAIGNSSVDFYITNNYIEYDIQLCKYKNQV